MTAVFVVLGALLVIGLVAGAAAACYVAIELYERLRDVQRQRAAADRLLLGLACTLPDPGVDGDTVLRAAFPEAQAPLSAMDAEAAMQFLSEWHKFEQRRDQARRARK